VLKSPGILVACLVVIITGMSTQVTRKIPVPVLILGSGAGTGTT
jgi:ketopantoate hydroxymethyltransferase